MITFFCKIFLFFFPLFFFSFFHYFCFFFFVFSGYVFLFLPDDPQDRSSPGPPLRRTGFRWTASFAGPPLAGPLRRTGLRWTAPPLDRLKFRSFFLHFVLSLSGGLFVESWPWFKAMATPQCAVQGHGHPTVARLGSLWLFCETLSASGEGEEIHCDRGSGNKYGPPISSSKIDILTIFRPLG